MTQDTPSPRPDRLSGRDLALRGLDPPRRPLQHIDDAGLNRLRALIERLEATVDDIRAELS